MIYNEFKHSMFALEGKAWQTEEGRTELKWDDRKHWTYLSKMLKLQKG